MPKKLKFQRETIFKDANGSVEAEVEEKVYQLPQEPPFVKLYLNDIQRLYDLPKTSNGLLYELFRCLNFNEEIILNSEIRARIAKSLDIRKQTLANQIQALIKKDIMRRTGSNTFMLNPKLFAQGQWKNVRKQRNKYLSLQIDYNDKCERVISSKFVERPAFDFENEDA